MKDRSGNAVEGCSEIKSVKPAEIGGHMIVVILISELLSADYPDECDSDLRIGLHVMWEFKTLMHLFNGPLTISSCIPLTDVTGKGKKYHYSGRINRTLMRMWNPYNIKPVQKYQVWLNLQEMLVKTLSL